jgi:hypothetical protein
LDTIRIATMSEFTLNMDDWEIRITVTKSAFSLRLIVRLNIQSQKIVSWPPPQLAKPCRFWRSDTEDIESFGNPTRLTGIENAGLSYSNFIRLGSGGILFATNKQVQCERVLCGKRQDTKMS